MFHRDAEYRQGVELFNRGEFWECHEVLEEIWHGERGSRRRFYQGLIQVAIAFHHFRSQNVSGARILLAEGSESLEPYRPVHEGIDVDRLLAELGEWRAALDRAPETLPVGLEVPKLELQEGRLRS